MVHIYTGNGKGKTTAALGLSMRAAGAGKKVFFGQFVKGMAYGEVKLINEQIPQIDHQLFGRNCFIKREPEQSDYEEAQKGLEKIRTIIRSGEYQVIVLDELNIALYYKLLEPGDIIALIDELSPEIELIITGRYVLDELIEKADLVTEMKEIKHYFHQDIKARRGIEF